MNRHPTKDDVGRSAVLRLGRCVYLITNSYAGRGGSDRGRDVFRVEGCCCSLTLWSTDLFVLADGDAL